MHVVSDDERREVARMLRELRGGWSSGECYYTIIHALDLPYTSREDGGAALYARLADLIEPSCDRDALLAVAETLEDCAGRGSDLTALGYSCLAKRIREALGVTGNANA